MKAIVKIFLGIMICLSSCSFLDEEVISEITEDNYYQTQEDAVAAVNALYDYISVGNSPLWGGEFGGVYYNDYWIIQGLCSDEMRTASPPGSPYYQLSDFSFNSSNIAIEKVWKDAYKTINNANVAYEKIPPISMDESMKKRLLGEVTFFRGMLYFDLVRMYGDLPLKLEYTKSVDDIEIERSSSADVYEQIELDLRQAMSDLPDSYTGGDVGRCTSGAAKTLLAKVLLTQGKYGEALELLREIIHAGRYTLFNDFQEVFKISNANTREIIFSVPFSNTMSQGWKGSQFNVQLLPAGLNNGSEGPENAQGWQRPTVDLYESYELRDRRRAVTFITSYEYSDGSMETFDPHISKWWDRDAEPRGNQSDQDYIYLRYADVLLMAAEAINELNGGPTGEAYEYINQIRRRARFDGVQEWDILRDLSGLSYPEFKEAVLEERRHEFVAEGHRWFDLVRNDKLVEKVLVNSEKDDALVADYHNLLPVPQRDRELNSRLTQNPGY